MAPVKDPVPLSARAAPHVVLFCAALLLTALVASWALPKVTGEKVFAGPVESGVPVNFSVSGAEHVDFHLAHRFDRIVGPGQNATLTVLDASGREVFNESASVGPLGKNKDERDQQIFPSIPPFHPPEGGTYRAVYTYVNGTPAREHLVVIEGGWRFREGPGDLFYLTLAPTTVLLVVFLFFVRPVDPQGEGRNRFYPVRGATRGSLLAALAAGALAAALLLYVVGGGAGLL